VTFAPIYFAKETPGFSFKFFIPFFWNYENRKTNFASRVVFPLYWRFRGKSGTVTKVVPPIWWRYNEKRDMLANGLPLLWHYERAGLKRRMYFLWIPINLSPLDRLAPAGD